MNLPSHIWIDSLTYAFSRMSLFTYASTFSRMDWLSPLSYAFSRTSLFTYESTFSRMDWLSYLCVLTNEPFHVWIYLLTYGVTLLLMLPHAWAFWPMNPPSHILIDSLTYACEHMSLFTYDSKTFYFYTYSLTLIPVLSHAWTLLHMNLLLHVWIDSLTYESSDMSLFTYDSTCTRMDWLSYLCFLTHEPFYLCIYFFTYGVTLSPMNPQTWAFSPMDLPSHVWIDFLTYSFGHMSLFTYKSTFSRMQ